MDRYIVVYKVIGESEKYTHHQLLNNEMGALDTALDYARSDKFELVKVLKVNVETGATSEMDLILEGGRVFLHGHYEVDVLMEMYNGFKAELSK